MHWQLVAALADCCVTIYGDEANDPFRPHLTLVQQISPEAAQTVAATVARLPHQFTFPVTEAALVGRRHATAWEPLLTFPLGSTRPAASTPAGSFP